MKFSNPFKKQPTKEQKREAYRRWAIIKYQLYPMLVKECSSVHDVKRRLESASQALQNEMMVRVGELKKLMGNEILSKWAIKPLKGKGEEIEQKIFDILKNEKIEIVDELLSHLPRILDTFILQELSERKPETLRVKFNDDNIHKV
jgi:dGTP triphosphohydrolase